MPGDVAHRQAVFARQHKDDPAFRRQLFDGIVQNGQFLSRLQNRLGSRLLGCSIGCVIAAMIQDRVADTLPADVVKRGIRRGAGKVIARGLHHQRVFATQHVQENILHQILGIGPTTHDMPNPPNEAVTLGPEKTAQL